MRVPPNLRSLRLDYLMLSRAVLRYFYVSTFCMVIFTAFSLHAHPSLQIDTQKGAVCLSVELAQTPEKLKKGLMGRKFLQDNHGMLFVFPQVSEVRFWMKNTFLALDLLFIDQQGKIVHMHPHAPPLSLEYIYSQYPVKAVLEILAGRAKLLNIQVGDLVYHPVLNSKGTQCL